MINGFAHAPLGKRLTLAFASQTLLTLIIGLVAIVMWHRLDSQVAAISAEQVPAWNAAYQLEKNSTTLQNLLRQRAQSQETQHFQHQNQAIETLIAALESHVLPHNTSSNNRQQSQQQLAALRALIDQQNTLLSQRLNLRASLTQERNRINWLHQDLVDEVQPLVQEIEWHVNRLVSERDQRQSPFELVHEFAVLQELSIRENELMTLVHEIIAQRYQRDLTSAFMYIQVKIEAMQQLSAQLAHYPSTITHRQILDEIINEVKPNGPLQQLLAQDIANQQALATLMPKLDAVLAKLHQQVQQRVSAANQAIQHLDQKTQLQLKTGQWLIIACAGIAVVINLLVMTVLISRRLVGRLNQLSVELSRANLGEKGQPVSISGNDEIGQLGQQLNRFYLQRQEMERTNALSLINQTDACLITCFLDGHIESANPSAMRLLDFEQDPSQLCLWQAFPAHLKTALEALFAPPTQKESSTTLCVGESHLHFALRRFVQSNEPRYMVTITDVTSQEQNRQQLARLVDQKTQDLQRNNAKLAAEIEQHKATQATLMQTQDGLIQAAKMAVVGQAMTSLAHELNQPLAAINNYLYSGKLMIEAQQYSQLPEHFGHIERMSQRMSRIILALRNFAKKSPATNALQSINLTQLVDSATVMVESRANQERIRIINDIPAQCFVQADATQLEQVFVNLLVNALDAVAGQARREIHLFHQHSFGVTQILVCDSGAGFAPALVPQLFTPFTTSKEVGLGLGLSICRSIMQRFDGEIYLASHCHGGACLVLEFKDVTTATSL
ncbi:Adaptive-response sensory-kinase SasA [Vibrio stylophorae]|uniref:histidine kinase n=1 Tax=Vibrio stylophorae TaxID=659351 RepID=A0ABN8DNQ2_9VIBR|nr:ATP-binding protein [Vibrio stylophorae]CAH0532806.1 Adaptive-response sensory-kinase SasA [Vibrio stylophorae]